MFKKLISLILILTFALQSTDALALRTPATLKTNITQQIQGAMHGNRKQGKALDAPPNLGHPDTYNAQSHGELRLYLNEKDMTQEEASVEYLPKDVRLILVEHHPKTPGAKHPMLLWSDPKTGRWVFSHAGTRNQAGKYIYMTKQAFMTLGAKDPNLLREILLDEALHAQEKFAGRWSEDFHRSKDDKLRKRLYPYIEKDINPVKTATQTKEPASKLTRRDFIYLAGVAIVAAGLSLSQVRHLFRSESNAPVTAQIREQGPASKIIGLYWRHIEGDNFEEIVRPKLDQVFSEAKNNGKKIIYVEEGNGPDFNSIKRMYPQEMQGIVPMDVYGENPDPKKLARFKTVFFTCLEGKEYAHNKPDMGLGNYSGLNPSKAARCGYLMRNLKQMDSYCFEGQLDREGIFRTHIRSMAANIIKVNALRELVDNGDVKGYVEKAEKYNKILVEVSKERDEIFAQQLKDIISRNERKGNGVYVVYLRGGAHYYYGIIKQNLDKALEERFEEKDFRPTCGEKIMIELGKNSLLSQEEKERLMLANALGSVIWIGARKIEKTLLAVDKIVRGLPAAEVRDILGSLSRVPHGVKVSPPRLSKYLLDKIFQAHPELRQLLSGADKQAAPSRIQGAMHESAPNKSSQASDVVTIKQLMDGYVSGIEEKMKLWEDNPAAPKKDAAKALDSYKKKLAMARKYALQLRGLSVREFVEALKNTEGVARELSDTQAAALRIANSQPGIDPGDVLFLEGSCWLRDLFKFSIANGQLVEFTDGKEVAEVVLIGADINGLISNTSVIMHEALHRKCSPGRRISKRTNFYLHLALEEAAVTELTMSSMIDAIASDEALEKEFVAQLNPDQRIIYAAFGKIPEGAISRILYDESVYKYERMLLGSILKMGKGTAKILARFFETGEEEYLKDVFKKKYGAKTGEDVWGKTIEALEVIADHQQFRETGLQVLAEALAQENAKAAITGCNAVLKLLAKIFEEDLLYVDGVDAEVEKNDGPMEEEWGFSNGLYEAAVHSAAVLTFRASLSMPKADLKEKTLKKVFYENFKQAHARGAAVYGKKTRPGDGIRKPHVGSTAGRMQEAILRAYELLITNKMSYLEAAEAIVKALKGMREPEYIVNMKTAIDILRGANSPEYDPYLDILEKYSAATDHTPMISDIRQLKSKELNKLAMQDPIKDFELGLKYAASEAQVDRCLTKLEESLREKIASRKIDAQQIDEAVQEINKLLLPRGYIAEKSPLGLADERFAVLYQVSGKKIYDTTQGPVEVLFVRQSTVFSKPFLRTIPLSAPHLNKHVVIQLEEISRRAEQVSIPRPSSDDKTMRLITLRNRLMDMAWRQAIVAAAKDGKIKRHLNTETQILDKIGREVIIAKRRQFIGNNMVLRAIYHEMHRRENERALKSAVDAEKEKASAVLFELQGSLEPWSTLAEVVKSAVNGEEYAHLALGRLTGADNQDMAVTLLEGIIKKGSGDDINKLARYAREKSGEKLEIKKAKTKIAGAMHETTGKKGPGVIFKLGGLREQGAYPEIAQIVAEGKGKANLLVHFGYQLENFFGVQDLELKLKLVGHLYSDYYEYLLNVKEFLARSEEPTIITTTAPELVSNLFFAWNREGWTNLSPIIVISVDRAKYNKLETEKALAGRFDELGIERVETIGGENSDDCVARSAGIIKNKGRDAGIDKSISYQPVAAIQIQPDIQKAQEAFNIVKSWANGQAGLAVDKISGAMHEENGKKLELDHKTKSAFGSVVASCLQPHSNNFALKDFFSTRKPTPAFTQFLFSKLEQNAHRGDYKSARKIADMIVIINSIKGAEGRSLIPRFLHAQDKMVLETVGYILNKMGGNLYINIINTGTRDAHAIVRQRCFDYLKQKMSEGKDVFDMVRAYAIVSKPGQEDRQDYIARIIAESGDKAMPKIVRIKKGTKYKHAATDLVQKIEAHKNIIRQRKAAVDICARSIVGLDKLSIRDRSVAFIYSPELISDPAVLSILPGIAKALEGKQGSRIILVARKGEKDRFKAFAQNPDIVVTEENDLQAVLAAFKDQTKIYLKTQNEPDIKGVDVNKAITQGILTQLGTMVKDKERLEDLKQEIANLLQA